MLSKYTLNFNYLDDILLYMLYENKHKNVTWIDLENPTQDEVRGLVERYDIDPLVADELLVPSSRSHVDVYDNCLYLLLHFPQGHAHKNEVHQTRDVQEIDFVIGHDFIITTRYGAIDELHEFSKVFEVNSILDKSDMGNHAGYIFFYMIEYFYQIMHGKIENIRDTLGDIEDGIFEGKEKAMVYELAKINWLLLTFKESLLLHGEVLHSFEKAGLNFFGEPFKHHLKGITSQFDSVKRGLIGTKEYLDELRQTNDTLLATKQNEIMKTLTVMAFVVLPLSLIAGIFGMNAHNMPFIGDPNDFLIILLIMVSMALLMFIFFRHKKWL